VHYIELVHRAFEPHRGRFHLAVVASLAQARAYLEEASVHLIIADLRLPDGPGTDLLGAEGEERKVPLVVMTVKVDEEAALASMTAGALDYVIKSEDELANLPRTAERVLREWRYITEHQVAEQALIRFSQENSMTAEIGRIVDSSLNICELYEAFGAEVRKLIPFDCMSLSFVNYEERTMSPTWVVGTDVPGLREGDDFPMERSLAGEVVRTKAPVMLDADTEPDLEQRYRGLIPVYNAGTVSFMAVPLWSRDSVIAVLRIESKHRGIYTQRHLEILERTGRQIAGAIANAKLYDERTQAEAAERRRSHELTGLYEISRIFSETGDFEVKATAAMEKLAVLAGADWVTLRLPKENAPGLHLMAASGPEVAEHPPTQVFTNAMTMSTAAFVEGKTAVIDDYANQPTASQALVDLGMQSMVILPIKSGDRTVGLVTVISKDKSYFRPELSALLIVVCEGLGVLLENSILQEDRKRSEQRMYEAARLASVGELAAGVAHEINNPLASIVMYAQLLMDSEAPEAMRRDLLMIDSEAKRAGKIVQSLLTFARENEPKRKLTDINVVLERALDLKSADMKSSGIQISRNLSSDPNCSILDDHDFTQVFVNILTNAQQAIETSGRAGHITIASSSSNGVIDVEIADNGSGIDPQIKGRIFEPFFTTKPEGAGTGLGLSICYGIVKDHDGDIWAGESSDRGATFRLRIPILLSDDQPI